MLQQDGSLSTLLRETAAHLNGTNIQYTVHMNDEFNNITTLEELWEWVKANRESPWRFPEKWGVRGYLGPLPLGIVADVPAPRSLNDVDDVFTTYYDRRLYRLMLKYGLENAHLMDTHISIVKDDDQDR